MRPRPDYSRVQHQRPLLTTLWCACFWIASGNLTLYPDARPSSASQETESGSNPFLDFRGQTPGTVHHINARDLPEPYATPAVRNSPRLGERPADAWPKVPPGFKVELYASGLDNPRLLRTAPNGDVFLAESNPGHIRVFRGITADGKAQMASVFAQDLQRPFGINFYPAGPNPQYVYVANTDSVVRFPYRSGDLRARGPAETVVSDIPSGARVTGGGHWTRDIAFSKDGSKMYVSVGSYSNVDDTDNNRREFERADILEFNPDGTGRRVYAWGIRNAVGIAVHEQTGELWASVNERDGLGDNLVPDYITRIQEGGFYGWPWYYIGKYQDPRHPGKHPELAAKVIVPDVLVQPHNASLQMTFYDKQQFPERFRGGIFAAQHGSWNRATPTGYEVIFVPVRNGRASGEYEDFATGFITSDGNVWGRPVGVTVASDGSLLVTDDGSHSVWRISYAAQP